MSLQTQRPKQDDLLAYYAKDEYCLEEAVLRNATGGAVDLVGTRGLPVKLVAGVYCVCLEADLANAIGVIISDKALALANATTGTEKHVILVRGPAVLRKDGLSATDAAGQALTKATLITALKTLNPPIIVKAQATQVTTQQT